MSEKLKIVIADDEVDVVKLCRVLIDHPNAEVVGEASNGLELLERIEEMMPDVVITDINMPGMTGLELIETAKDRFREVHFVIMSGYTDFEYVQTALRYGVWDYLLKPLQKKELNLILDKLDAQITGERQASTERQQMKNHLEKSDHVLREKFFRELWTGEASTLQAETEQELQMREENAFLALVICADSRKRMTDAEADALMHNAGSVFEQIKEAAEEYGWERISFDEKRMKVIAFLYPQQEDEERIRSFLAKTERELERYNNLNGFLTLTGGYSDVPQADTEHIALAFRQARLATQRRIEMGSGRLIKYDAEQDESVRQGMDGSLSERLRSAITDRNEAMASELALKIWRGQAEPAPGVAYRRLEELLHLINQALALLPDAGEILPDIEVRMDRILYEELTPRSIETHLTDAVREALQAHEAHLSGKSSGVIEKAKAYVNMHYAEEISLEEVSRLVYLSPAYFSTLFKTETGSNFIKYVQYVRMENAKKMLRDGSMKVEDIARAVGYRDVKHFNKVFRQETNVKPSEYRKLYS